MSLQGVPAVAFAELPWGRLFKLDPFTRPRKHLPPNACVPTLDNQRCMYDSGPLGVYVEQEQARKLPAATYADIDWPRPWIVFMFTCCFVPVAWAVYSRGPISTANMESGPKTHTWHGCWGLIPYWQSKWTLWVLLRRKGENDQPRV